METQEVTVLDREELEHLALMAVCACLYYDLADNIDTATDDELWRIIENPDAECRKHCQ